MRLPILGNQTPFESENLEPDSSSVAPTNQVTQPGAATTRLIPESESPPDELPLGIPQAPRNAPKAPRRIKTDDKADALGLNTRPLDQGQFTANQRRKRHLWTLVLVLVVANILIVAGACAWFYNVFAAEIETRLSDGITRLANIPSPPSIAAASPEPAPVKLDEWKQPVDELKTELKAEIKALNARATRIQSELQAQLAAAKERADAAEQRLKSYEEQSNAMVARLRDVAAATQSAEYTKPTVVAAESVPGGQSLPSKLLPSQSELVLLKERNRLTSLADDAIATAARGPYEQLWEAVKDPRMVNLVHGARAEILRVQQFYLSGSRLSKYEIPVAEVFPATPNLRDVQLSDDQLITLLSDPKLAWQNRLRASWLLGQRKSEKAAEALVKAVKEDQNLDVVKEATFSFEQMTGYRASLFEAKALEAWWKEFSSVPTIKKPVLPNAAAKAKAAKEAEKSAPADAKDVKDAKPPKP